MKRKLAFGILIAALLPFLSSGGSLRPQDAASINGMVVYPDGKPAAGARVFRYRSDNPTGLQGGAISGSDGRFVLDDLEPGITYAICASKTEEGYLDPSGLPFGLPVGGHCQHVVLRLGVDPSKVLLMLGNKSGMLSGRLIDAHTRGSVAGTVTLYRPLKLEKDVWTLVDPKLATWIPSVVDETDSTGKFNFANLPDGQFFLRVESKGYRPWFYLNQATESLARPIHVLRGSTRTLFVLLQPSSSHRD